MTRRNTKKAVDTAIVCHTVRRAGPNGGLIRLRDDLQQDSHLNQWTAVTVSDFPGNRAAGNQIEIHVLDGALPGEHNYLPVWMVPVGRHQRRSGQLDLV